MRGTVLPIALILLVVMATSAAGFLRLISASSDVARQVAFQRDAVNRGELAIRTAIRQFEPGSGRHFAGLNNTRRMRWARPAAWPTRPRHCRPTARASRWC